MNLALDYSASHGTAAAMGGSMSMEQELIKLLRRSGDPERAAMLAAEVIVEALYRLKAGAV